MKSVFHEETYKTWGIFCVSLGWCYGMVLNSLLGSLYTLLYGAVAPALAGLFLMIGAYIGYVRAEREDKEAEERYFAEWTEIPGGHLE